MRIKLYFFGKKNEINDFEKEMIRRIGFRCPIEIIPIAQAGVSGSDNAKKLEAEKLLSKISDQEFLIAFDENGKTMDSLEFSKKLKQWFINHGDVTFVIGGAHGIDQKVLSRANLLFSFGSMVWTRNLFRSMALEQIYRALEIEGGGNFHKE
jgi:23S rRNA (pseudouridine1915-N3)-methyltransferase